MHRRMLCSSLNVKKRKERQKILFKIVLLARNVVCFGTISHSYFRFPLSVSLLFLDLSCKGLQYNLARLLTPQKRPDQKGMTDLLRSILQLSG